LLSERRTANGEITSFGGINRRDAETQREEGRRGKGKGERGKAKGERGKRNTDWDTEFFRNLLSRK
jgi:hypothetical protein